jgi:hypothetical protein
MYCAVGAPKIDESFDALAPPSNQFARNEKWRLFHRLHAGQGVEHGSHHLPGPDGRVGLRHQRATHTVAGQNRNPPRRRYLFDFVISCCAFFLTEIKFADQQFLIQVSSAPPKSKVVPGPARLHIQDHKFCLTNGVPPRLLGCWEIGHLR